MEIGSVTRLQVERAVAHAEQARSLAPGSMVCVKFACLKMNRTVHHNGNDMNSYGVNRDIAAGRIRRLR